MNFRGLFYTLIALADAFVLIPSTTVQRTVLNQRRNLSGKKQEHNNLLDALKRSMSKKNRIEKKSKIDVTFGSESVVLYDCFVYVLVINIKYRLYCTGFTT